MQVQERLQPTHVNSSQAGLAQHIWIELQTNDIACERLPVRKLLCLRLLTLPGQGSHLLVSTEVTRTDGGLLSILMVGTEIALPSLSITGEHCQQMSMPYACFEVHELLACLPLPLSMCSL